MEPSSRSEPCASLTSVSWARQNRPAPLGPAAAAAWIPMPNCCWTEPNSLAESRTNLAPEPRANLTTVSRTAEPPRPTQQTPRRGSRSRTAPGQNRTRSQSRARTSRPNRARTSRRLAVQQNRPAQQTPRRGFRGRIAAGQNRTSPQSPARTSRRLFHQEGQHHAAHRPHGPDAPPFTPREAESVPDVTPHLPTQARNHTTPAQHTGEPHRPPARNPSQFAEQRRDQHRAEPIHAVTGHD